MTPKKTTARGRARSTRGIGTVVPWAALGLILFSLVGLALVGPGRLLSLATRRLAPQANGPLGLTIVHSNDTWGYLLPCG